TIMVGDINECFIVHVNDVIKYLSWDTDWSIAPSEACQRNPEMVAAIVSDDDFSPFVYDVTGDFDFAPVFDKLVNLSKGVEHRIRITKHNVITAFERFESHVLKNNELSPNDKANLFIQLLINQNE